MLQILPKKEWLLSIENRWSVSEFKIRAILSAEPETGLVPSVGYATVSTWSSCPVNGPTVNSLRSTFQIQIVLSQEPEAMCVPPDGENTNSPYLCDSQLLRPTVALSRHLSQKRWVARWWERGILSQKQKVSRLQKSSRLNWRHCRVLTFWRVHCWTWSINRCFYLWTTTSNRRLCYGIYVMEMIVRCWEKYCW